MVERSIFGKTNRPAATDPEPGGDAPAPIDPARKAVALTYKPDTMDSAPVVSASGQGALAERILEAAREAGVPIQEDPDLVELLAATEVGAEIPVEAFIAVAEILRYVYQANGRAAPQPGGAAGAGAGPRAGPGPGRPIAAPWQTDPIWATEATRAPPTAGTV